jgi:hypothetical protein
VAVQLAPHGESVLPNVPAAVIVLPDLRIRALFGLRIASSGDALTPLRRATDRALVKLGAT